MPREIKAIPTSYSGIQLKSRMEAQTSLLCDVLGWAWEYEPYSIMLSSGIAYIPDFRAEKYTIIETRGYVSRKGQAQIKDFAQKLYAPEENDPATPHEQKILDAIEFIVTRDEAAE